MSTRRFYITTAIPYANGDPHLGHALEFVQADVLARHRRLRGEDVRFLSGTDDNALKNAVAADVAGVPVARFVEAKARAFADLARPLDLSYDDFIHTSSDRRHRPGVERLWRRCADSGDLYERDYEGLYCTGCEAFLLPQELEYGRCPEHRTAPERVSERNWFFRLTRYEDSLLALIESRRLRLEPEARRNEVLALVRGGLRDFSVSRPRDRARGWGIPVPNDPTQVVYVWFDALANYVSALGYGGDRRAYRRWWCGSAERLHTIGKGILRFHAVYWPAILLSAREPLPSALFVHDYLTVDGGKLSKSRSAEVAPEALVEQYGVDAVRWWLLRDGSRPGDADFRHELLAARGNELADGLGNLVARTLALAPAAAGAAGRQAARAPGAHELAADAAGLASAIDDGLADFDFQRATRAIWDVVATANRFVSRTRPWELAAPARRGDRESAARLRRILDTVLDACRLVAVELQPFLPAGSTRLQAVLDGGAPELARRLFPKYR